MTMPTYAPNRPGFPPPKIEAADAGLWTSQQVADHLSVSVRTVWRLVAKGDLPQPIRYNRKLVRFQSAQVLAYVEKIASAQGRKTR